MADSSHHAKRWQVTAAVFRQLAKSIQPTDWRPTAPATGTAFPDEHQRHSVRQAILATYKPVLQECLDVTAGWFASRYRTLPNKISQPARYWIYQMACQIASFCEAHVCKLTQAPSTIIPYPDKKEIEVCDWLVSEWWPDVGLMRCVAQSTTDQSLFYSENI